MPAFFPLNSEIARQGKETTIINAGIAKAIIDLGSCCTSWKRALKYFIASERVKFWLISHSRLHGIVCRW